MPALDWAQARRYLGLTGAETGLEPQLRQAGQAVLSAAAPRRVWRRFPLERQGSALSFASLTVDSGDLAAHLEGCEQVILLACTLGLEVDRLLQRLSVTDMSQAVMAQACAAALLEGECDALEEELARQSPGWYLRPRFSPGYGDFSPDCQSRLLALLEAGKRIGLAATAGQMLTPTKSVTALVGLSRQPGPCHRLGCAACGKSDCDFRREG